MGLTEDHLGFAMVCLSKTNSGASRSARLISSAACCSAALPQARRRVSGRLRRVRARLPQVRGVLGSPTSDEGGGSRYKVLVSEGRRSSQDHRQAATSTRSSASPASTCWRSARQGPARRRAEAGGAAAVEHCRSTSVDDDWVSELIGLKTAPPAARTRTYVT